MDRIRFWRHSSPLVGVSSNDMPTVFETVINGEPLDWLWSQAGGHDAYGSTPERDSVDWMAVLDSEVAGDGYSLMRAGTEPRRIPVLQVLMRGARVGTVTVSVSETAAGGMSWSEFQADDGCPVDLGPFVFDARSIARPWLTLTKG